MEKKWRLKFQEDLLQAGDCIVIGLSGGPDSMLLAWWLAEMREKYQLHLHAVHLNHNIRPEAEAEAQFVARWCAECGIDCTVGQSDVPQLAREQKLSLEEAGHRARHELFHAVGTAIGASKLALGHHLDDRAETVLLHLIKGASPEGLAAMPAQDGWIIRPLGRWRKAEILTACQALDLPYCLDRSNEETIYLRNRLRLELLPLLRAEYNPRIDEALDRLAWLCHEDKQYWQEVVSRYWQARGGCDERGFFLDLSAWAEVPMSLQRRLLRYGYQLLRPESQGLDFQAVDDLLALCAKNNGFKQIALPKAQAVKVYDRLYFSAPKAWQACAPFAYSWDGKAALTLAPLGLCLRGEVSDKPLPLSNDCFTALIDGGKLSGPLTVRSRRDGDRFWPLGAKGGKKLKDYFIDKKVPQNLRGQIPLVFAGEELVWVVGYAIGEKFRVTDETEIFCRFECFAQK